MDARLEERITNLEIKLTYQDDLIQALNEVVVELRGEVGRLARTVESLEAEARRGGPDAAGSLQEKPPHY
jgi:SlyX protein